MYLLRMWKIIMAVMIIAAMCIQRVAEKEQHEPIALAS